MRVLKALYTSALLKVIVGWITWKEFKPAITGFARMM